MNRKIILLALFLSSSCPLAAATFHAVLVGDTTSDLCPMVKKNLRSMKKTVHTTAKTLHCKENLHVVQGSKATGGNLLRTLKNLDIQEGDYFLFYYNGHGAREKWKKSPWPALYFSPTQDLFNLDDIIYLAGNTKAQCSLIMADCCNVEYGSDEEFPIPPIDQDYFNRLELSYDQSHLFKQGKPVMVAAAAIPYAPAWAISSGGIFTLSFLHSGANAVTWEQRFDQMLQETEGIQTPLSGTFG